MTRSRLASLTGLSRSTMADLIGELSSLDLVEEGPGLTPSGPGRPSPMVHTRPDGAVVLAVELSVDSLAVATVGLGGHVFDRRRVERPREHVSPEEAVHDVAGLARPLLDSLPPNHRLVGVGVGVVGITRRSDGLVHLAPNLGWRDVPIGKLLSRPSSAPGSRSWWPTRPTSGRWPSTGAGGAPACATSSTSPARSASAPGSSSTASRCSAPRATPARPATP